MKHAEPWPHGANVMDLDGPERIVVVAHRGDSGNHPENTRAAFEAAVAGKFTSGVQDATELGDLYSLDYQATTTGIQLIQLGS